MVSQAAHLGDYVLPRVPIRQWVFALPWELRALLAYRPAVLDAIRWIWWERVQWWLRVRADKMGLKGTHAGGGFHP